MCLQILTAVCTHRYVTAWTDSPCPVIFNVSHPWHSPAVHGAPASCAVRGSSADCCVAHLARSMSQACEMRFLFDIFLNCWVSWDVFSVYEDYICVVLVVAIYYVRVLIFTVCHFICSKVVVDQIFADTQKEILGNLTLQRLKTERGVLAIRMKQGLGLHLSCASYVSLDSLCHL